MYYSRFKIQNGFFFFEKIYIVSCASLRYFLFDAIAELRFSRACKWRVIATKDQCTPLLLHGFYLLIVGNLLEESFVSSLFADSSSFLQPDLNSPDPNSKKVIEQTDVRLF